MEKLYVTQWKMLGDYWLRI